MHAERLQLKPSSFAALPSYSRCPIGASGMRSRNLPPRLSEILAIILARSSSLSKEQISVHIEIARSLYVTPACRQPKSVKKYLKEGRPRPTPCFRFSINPDSSRRSRRCRIAVAVTSRRSIKSVTESPSNRRSRSSTSWSTGRIGESEVFAE